MTVSKSEFTREIIIIKIKIKQQEKGPRVYSKSKSEIKKRRITREGGGRVPRSRLANGMWLDQPSSILCTSFPPLNRSIEEKRNR